jgi:hypothetical protein
VNRPETPKIGSVYKHYKGAYYRVVTLAKQEGSGEWQVVYENTLGEVFVRPRCEWHGGTDLGGHRFDLVRNDPMNPWGNQE